MNDTELIHEMGRVLGSAKGALEIERAHDLAVGQSIRADSLTEQIRKLERVLTLYYDRQTPV